MSTLILEAGAESRVTVTLYHNPGTGQARMRVRGPHGYVTRPYDHAAGDPWHAALLEVLPAHTLPVCIDSGTDPKVHVYRVTH